jgi:hypothetical protein
VEDLRLLHQIGRGAHFDGVKNESTATIGVTRATGRRAASASYGAKTRRDGLKYTAPCIVGGCNKTGRNALLFMNIAGSIVRRVAWRLFFGGRRSLRFPATDAEPAIAPHRAQIHAPKNVCCSSKFSRPRQ